MTLSELNPCKEYQNITVSKGDMSSSYKVTYKKIETTGLTVGGRHLVSIAAGTGQTLLRTCFLGDCLWWQDVAVSLQDYHHFLWHLHTWGQDTVLWWRTNGNLSYSSYTCTSHLFAIYIATNLCWQIFSDQGSCVFTSLISRINSSSCLDLK